MTWDQLAEALDKMNPGWAVKYAEQVDLRDLANGYINNDTLRSRVVRELYEVCRAAVHAGLLIEPK